jgi:hypothetical protein
VNAVTRVSFHERREKATLSGGEKKSPIWGMR